ncbi:histidinol-phosphate transaminase [Kineosporia rhizophila]|uniref:histidinol-phosphate transaminase n=1 Tax=Kineosporia rhizophila TaxID=84633 RepID=UPI000AA82DC4|nr:histidinol-phosphate transaminase [Kineosporia rhizophila]MCE0537856.1 histidinol-phosphate transaminase [Kineosporia rhizophila]
MTLAPIRPELRGKSPYGAPQLDVPVRLNTNESPYPPGPELVADITASVTKAVLDLNRYPDRDAVELRTALAAYLSESTGVTRTFEQVWAANGSNEVLQQLMQAYAGPGRTVLGFEPTYSMHRTIAESTGSRYISGPRRPDFTLDPDAAVAVIREEQPDVVFLCTPNNPTGLSLDPETVLAVHDAFGGLLVLDEAYIEFSHEESLLSLLENRPRLVVSRTMSKAFGFAGARVGYLTADSRVIDALQLVRLPYHLSTVTQAIAGAALRHRKGLLQHVEDTKKERDRLIAEMRFLELTVVESDANFVLFQVPDAPGVWRRLLDAGVLIRDVGVAGHLRVTTGTPAENDQFLRALRELGGSSTARNDRAGLPSLEA